MKKTQTLSSYINSKLRIYQYGVPIAMSLLIGLSTVVFLLLIRVSTDQALLKDIAPHISTLVETQDRSELARLIKSIATERNVDISLVKDKKIMVSSKSLDLFDSTYLEDKPVFNFFGSVISKSFASSTRIVSRPNGPDTHTSIVLSSPLLPILYTCGVAALLILMIGFGLSYLFAYQIKQVVHSAVGPIKKINEQIRSLKNIDEEHIYYETPITEFNAIQLAITDTQKALLDARDILALAKAKEMTTEAYRRLVHDLHTPVSALQQMIVTASSTNDPKDKEKASIAIPRIAFQVVSQIEAAKQHLTIDNSDFKTEDLRTCLQESIFQAEKSQGADNEILKILPDMPILIPHDSSQLRRAISNIVVNALQACKEKVQVSLLEEGSKVVIRIEDDGPGISLSQASTFLQGRGISKKSNRRAYGMAGANHIVRLHGGRIVSKNSSFGGACFEVQL